MSVNIGLDIMLMTSAKVDIDGGFQLQIPDGEQMWLDVNALTMSAKHSSTYVCSSNLPPTPGIPVSPCEFDHLCSRHSTLTNRCHEWEKDPR